MVYTALIASSFHMAILAVEARDFCTPNLTA